MSFSNLTEVKFRELTEAEIDHYIATEPPLDKAGSYGIQDWIGMVKVKSIQGSFFNIMGLPSHLVYENLKEFK